ncbi:MAG: hypothetical protein E1N59_1640 [Puniceicoccaceae bacterium 5H]|nr:MAG: hypothetical protein E1N59_1640 [Puniceicoccaceae bacterium 5H]
MGETGYRQRTLGLGKVGPEGSLWPTLVWIAVLIEIGYRHGMALWAQADRLRAGATAYLHATPEAQWPAPILDSVESEMRFGLIMLVLVAAGLCILLIRAWRWLRAPRAEVTLHQLSYRPHVATAGYTIQLQDMTRISLNARGECGLVLRNGEFFLLGQGWPRKRSELLYQLLLDRGVAGDPLPAEARWQA